MHFSLFCDITATVADTAARDVDEADEGLIQRGGKGRTGKLKYLPFGGTRHSSFGTPGSAHRFDVCLWWQLSYPRQQRRLILPIVNAETTELCPAQQRLVVHAGQLAFKPHVHLLPGHNRSGSHARNRPRDQFCAAMPARSTGHIGRNQGKLVAHKGQVRRAQGRGSWVTRRPCRNRRFSDVRRRRSDAQT